MTGGRRQGFRTPMLRGRKDLPKYTPLAEKNLFILSKKNRVNQCPMWSNFNQKRRDVIEKIPKSQILINRDKSPYPFP
jgi:hypothetical protein